MRRAKSFIVKNGKIKQEAAPKAMDAHGSAWLVRRGPDGFQLYNVDRRQGLDAYYDKPEVAFRVGRKVFACDPTTEIVQEAEVRAPVAPGAQDCDAGDAGVNPGLDVQATVPRGE